MMVKRGQQNIQGDFIGRLLPFSAFHQTDHAVEKALAGIGGDPHDQPVGQDPGAAGHGAAVTAAFADDRRAFAGDGAFVHRGNPFDHLAVGGDDVAGFHQDRSPWRSAVAGTRLVGRAMLGLASAFWPWISWRVRRRASAWALPRPSASASAKLAKRTVNHSQTEHAEDEAGRRFTLTEQSLDEETGGQNTADFDDKHHRVADLPTRVEFAKSVNEARRYKSCLI